MKTKLWIAAAAAAFLAAGPLQHVGAIPQTVIGDASKATIKAALHAGTKEAYACSFPGGGATGGVFPGQGGWKWHNTHLGAFINGLRDWIREHRR
jgi:hypothetical protein